MRAGASFLVAPSRYEPCGLIHLELRRFGVPALASDTGGHHDTIITSGPHKNGYLFKSENNWWSNEQDAAVVASIEPAMKDAHASLEGFMVLMQEALKTYLDATRTMIRDTAWPAAGNTVPMILQALFNAWNMSMPKLYAIAVRSEGKFRSNARLLSFQLLWRALSFCFLGK